MTDERNRKTIISAPIIPDRMPGEGGGDLTPELLETSAWTESMLASAGIPIIDVPFVTVGGGIGSFVMVDYLKIAGVPSDQIKVLTNISFAWQTYEYLTRVSQIPDESRIRSDSSSRPPPSHGVPRAG